MPENFLVKNVFFSQEIFDPSSPKISWKNFLVRNGLCCRPNHWTTESRDSVIQRFGRQLTVRSSLSICASLLVSLVLRNRHQHPYIHLQYSASMFTICTVSWRGSLFMLHTAVPNTLFLSKYFVALPLLCVGVCAAIPFILDVRRVDAPAEATKDFSTFLPPCLT